MFMNVRRRCAALTAAAATALAAAGAAEAMTISLGTPNLSSRILVSVPVTVTCSPFDPSLVPFGSDINVTVEQAAGQKIAFGIGGAFGAFACDGMPHTVEVNVLANTAGAPFHGGPAVFSARASASAGTPCFPGSTTCFIPPFEVQFDSITTSLVMH